MRHAPSLFRAEPLMKVDSDPTLLLGTPSLLRTRCWRIFLVPVVVLVGGVWAGGAKQESSQDESGGRHQPYPICHLLQLHFFPA